MTLPRRVIAGLFGIRQQAGGVDLTADELHVLLDVIAGMSDPWDGYDTDPDWPDPKTTEAGWRALLASATAKLNSRLSIL